MFLSLYKHSWHSNKGKYLENEARITSFHFVKLFRGFSFHTLSPCWILCDPTSQTSAPTMVCLIYRTWHPSFDGFWFLFHFILWLYFTYLNSLPHPHASIQMLRFQRGFFLWVCLKLTTSSLFCHHHFRSIYPISPTLFFISSWSNECEIY